MPHTDAENLGTGIATTVPVPDGIEGTGGAGTENVITAVSKCRTSLSPSARCFCSAQFLSSSSKEFWLEPAND